uniref:tRNA-synt_2 domain-containing protein n=1 Tax=Angiostrongylus cantonensis TaxID=6313 RepID=A0A0K0DGM6_ANGCA
MAWTIAKRCGCEAGRIAELKDLLLMAIGLRGVRCALSRSRRLFSDTSTRPLEANKPSSDVHLNGWVQKSQRCGSYVFLHLSDGTTANQIQIVVPKDLCRTGSHNFLQNRGYVHIDTPMLTFNDCEGAGETFSVAVSSAV